MASVTSPSLSVGNHIYLYRLLRDALGAGKQTLLPAVEQALDAERMGAQDLGFETTRDLLEQLDDCIKLTVFKGGRIYATVVAQPLWDEALNAADSNAASSKGSSTKSWKRKKTDKSLKPVRPKRIKRDKGTNNASAQDENPSGNANDSLQKKQLDKLELRENSCDESLPLATTDDSQQAGARERTAASKTPQNTVAESDNDDAETSVPEKTVPSEGHSAPAPDETTTVQDAGGADAPEAPLPDKTESAISLTVVYDPEHANAGITTLEAAADHDDEAECETPAGAGRDADAEASASTTAARAKSQPEPSRATRSIALPTEHDGQADGSDVKHAASTDDALCKLLESYPKDFTRDVFCPGAILHELGLLLPLGADVLGIMTEYFYITQLRGTLTGTRRRFSFPMGYTDHGERKWVTITCKRNDSDRGAAWVIDAVSTE